MAMKAKIKFNSSARAQATQFLAALKNSFTPSMMEVELEEITYAPSPVRSMDLVFQDLNSQPLTNQVEVILLEWNLSSSDATPVKIHDGRLLCNLTSKTAFPISLVHCLKEFINLLTGIKAKEYAKTPVFTPSAVEEHVAFYLATQRVYSQFQSKEEPQDKGFQKYLLVDKSYEVWVQLTEFKRILIPLKKGWERALFLFILENKNGFSFTDFRTKQDSNRLAYFYTLTKGNNEQGNIQKEIIYRIENDQFGQFFSPHFSRIRNAVAKALGHYPDVLEFLSIPKLGPIKNIQWDRSAIVWE